MIPVTVLTGFLGSGKTTLLARLLRDSAFSRTAVIMNELGEIGLDHELVETADESFVQLSTGCLCCRVRSDLVATLADLAGRRAAGTVPAFERVVVETTGLADPVPIVQALMADRDLQATYALERVIATVDAAAGAASLDRHVESLRQVALADTLVLTKTDLVGAPAEALARRLRAVNPRAQQLTAVRGEVSAETLFAGLHAATLDWIERPTTGTAVAMHSEGITHFSLVRDAPLRGAALALFLSALAENCGADLLRVKGIVAVVEAPGRPAVIHGVQHVYSAPEWLERWPSDDRRTRMVFIGRGIRERWVRLLLELIEAEAQTALD